MTTCDNENGIARPMNKSDPSKEYPITWEKPFWQPHAAWAVFLPGVGFAGMPDVAVRVFSDAAVHFPRLRFGLG